jgi:hypothetical protein
MAFVASASVASACHCVPWRLLHLAMIHCVAMAFVASAFVASACHCVPWRSLHLRLLHLHVIACHGVCCICIHQWLIELPWRFLHLRASMIHCRRTPTGKNIVPPIHANRNCESAYLFV